MKQIIAATSMLCLVLSGCQTRELKPAPQASTDTNAPLYMRLSDGDITLADQTVQQALESSLSMNPLSWRNPKTGNSGVVVPIRTYRSAYGTFCRHYKETVVIGRQREVYTDTACRNPQGEWIPI